MRIFYRTFKLLVIFNSLLLGVKCTENPFDNEDKILANSIMGKVELSDQQSPDNVHVWFKAFNISTRTDENGNFELKLPTETKQSGGGLDGIYSLYFYVANYVVLYIYRELIESFPRALVPILKCFDLFKHCVLFWGLLGVIHANLQCSPN